MNLVIVQLVHPPFSSVDGLGGACMKYGRNYEILVENPHKKRPVENCKGKVIPLHAMEAHGVRGGIAPTHS
jgi:hypothetical protein